MYLMYVDESGDAGMINTPTRYFVLTGLVVHELRWQQYFDQMVAFRQRMRILYGLKLREEIHAGAMMSRPGPLARIKPHNRLNIIRNFADEIATMSDINIINVLVDKDNKTPDYDVFGNAWRCLLQRFENTLSNRNFRGPANSVDKGIVIADNTDNKKLVKLLRKMRRFNPIPSMVGYGTPYRNILVTDIIEDPSFRESSESLYIQAADTVAYLLYQYFAPSGKIRKRGAQKYFEHIKPVLCTKATTKDPLGMGIVRL
jgi:Protein of unknown function (DUF3800)